MPDTGGPPARLAEGEDLAIDPAGRLLVIHSSQGMVRVQLPSAAAEPIVLPAGMRLASVNLSPSAIDRKGRILLSVVTPQDFDYKPAIVDGTIYILDSPARICSVASIWTNLYSRSMQSLRHAKRLGDFGDRRLLTLEVEAQCAGGNP